MPFPFLAAAAPIVGSLVGGLFSGSGNDTTNTQSGTSNTTVSPNVPGNVTGGWEGYQNNLNNFTGQPFPYWQGPAPVTPQSPFELEAQQQVLNAPGVGDPLLNGASQYALNTVNQGGLPPQAIYDQLFNQYNQNVTDVAKEGIWEDRDRMYQELGSQAAMSGAFGGSRHGVQKGEIDRGTLRSLAETQYQGNKEGHDTAYNNWFKSLGSSTDAANLATGLGETQQDRQYRYADSLNQLGLQQRQQASGYDDWAKQQYGMAYQDPFNKGELGAAQFALPWQAYGADSTTKTTGTATDGGGSLLDSLWGGAQMGSSFAGSFGKLFGGSGGSSSGSTGWLGALTPPGGFKDGGHIKGYADGGKASGGKHSRENDPDHPERRRYPTVTQEQIYNILLKLHPATAPLSAVVDIESALRNVGANSDRRQEDQEEHRGYHEEEYAEGGSVKYDLSSGRRGDPRGPQEAYVSYGDSGYGFENPKVAELFQTYLDGRHGENKQAYMENRRSMEPYEGLFQQLQLMNMQGAGQGGDVPPGGGEAPPGGGIFGGGQGSSQGAGQGYYPPSSADTYYTGPGADLAQQYYGDKQDYINRYFGPPVSQMGMPSFGGSGGAATGSSSGRRGLGGDWASRRAERRAARQERNPFNMEAYAEGGQVKPDATKHHRGGLPGFGDDTREGALGRSARLNEQERFYQAQAIQIGRTRFEEAEQATKLAYVQQFNAEPGSELFYAIGREAMENGANVSNSNALKKDDGNKMYSGIPDFVKRMMQHPNTPSTSPQLRPEPRVDIPGLLDESSDEVGGSQSRPRGFAAGGPVTNTRMNPFASHTRMGGYGISDRQAMNMIPNAAFQALNRASGASNNFSNAPNWASGTPAHEAYTGGARVPIYGAGSGRVGAANRKKAIEESKAEEQMLTSFNKNLGPIGSKNNPFMPLGGPQNPRRPEMRFADGGSVLRDPGGNAYGRNPFSPWMGTGAGYQNQQIYHPAEFRRQQAAGTLAPQIRNMGNTDYGQPQVGMGGFTRGQGLSINQGSSYPAGVTPQQNTDALRAADPNWNSPVPAPTTGGQFGNPFGNQGQPQNPVAPPAAAQNTVSNPVHNAPVQSGPPVITQPGYANPMQPPNSANPFTPAPQQTGASSDPMGAQNSPQNSNAFGWQGQGNPFGQAQQGGLGINMQSSQGTQGGMADLFGGQGAQPPQGFSGGGHVKGYNGDDGSSVTLGNGALNPDEEIARIQGERREENNAPISWLGRAASAVGDFVINPERQERNRWRGGVNQFLMENQLGGINEYSDEDLAGILPQIAPELWASRPETSRVQPPSHTPFGMMLDDANPDTLSLTGGNPPSPTQPSPVDVASSIFGEPSVGPEVRPETDGKSEISYDPQGRLDQFGEALSSWLSDPLAQQGYAAISGGVGPAMEGQAQRLRNEQEQASLKQNQLAQEWMQQNELAQRDFTAEQNQLNREASMAEAQLRADIARQADARSLFPQFPEDIAERGVEAVDNVLKYVNDHADTLPTDEALDQLANMIEGVAFGDDYVSFIVSQAVLSSLSQQENPTTATARTAEALAERYNIRDLSGAQ